MRYYVVYNVVYNFSIIITSFIDYIYKIKLLGAFILTFLGKM